MAEDAFKVLEERGATLVYGADLPHLECDIDILLYEFEQCINHYLSTCSPALKIRTLRDIVEYNNAHPDETLKYGQSILEDALYKTSGTLTDPKYIYSRLEALRKSQKDGIDRVLKENNLDLYVAPGLSDASPISGYPSIVVPIGISESDNMPFGLSFVGGAFSEPVLLRAAYDFEQATELRCPPHWD